MTSRTKAKLLTPPKKPATPAKKELSQKLMSLGQPKLAKKGHK